MPNSLLHWKNNLRRRVVTSKHECARQSQTKKQRMQSLVSQSGTKATQLVITNQEPRPRLGISHSEPRPQLGIAESEPRPRNSVSHRIRTKAVHSRLPQTFGACLFCTFACVTEVRMSPWTATPIEASRVISVYHYAMCLKRLLLGGFYAGV